MISDFRISRDFRNCVQDLKTVVDLLRHIAIWLATVWKLTFKNIKFCGLSKFVENEMPIKHEAKPSALLASRKCAECFILRIARARP